MAPLLLDTRSLLKLGACVLTGMVVMFGGGYYLGFDAALNRQQSVTVPVALLPEPALADASAYEPQPPLFKAEGEHIDVDLPDSLLQGDLEDDDAKAPAVTGHFSEQTSAAASTEESQTTASVANEESPLRQPVQVAMLDLETDVASDAVSDAVVAGEPGQDAPMGAERIADTATPETARFTIQTGMFADADNAERNRTGLQAIAASAYIDAYTNASEEQRYNVRFGWFSDKADALAALSEYESRHGGSGYVVFLKSRKSSLP